MKTTNTSGLLLLHHHRSSTLLLIFTHHSLQEQRRHWPLPPKLHLTTAATIHRLLLEPIYICRSRRWDSNAESFRTQNFDYNYDDDDDEEEDVNLEKWDEVLKDYFGSIWIFKVFGSYGWMLPFIILSLLVATGPKAFLMALALPLGQSTVSFVLQRIWGGRQHKRRQKTKTKNRSCSHSSRTVRLEEENKVGNQGNRKVKMGYHSWVPRDDASVNPSVKDAPSFGGWDELDVGSEFSVGSSRSSAQTAGQSNKTSSDKSRFSSGIRKSDLPLLLRLLIAVFPFLGSWTKML